MELEEKEIKLEKERLEILKLKREMGIIEWFLLGIDMIDAWNANAISNRCLK